MKSFKDLSEDQFAQHVQQAMQALPDAPPDWQQRAIDLWPQVSLRETAQALGRFVTAVLRFDSWATPGLAHGMRSGRGSTRHLLYSAQGRDIDLRITPVAERFALSGQILGPDETGLIELSPAEGAATGTHRGALDELGEFRLDGVPAGRYVLTLHVGAEPIVVQEIEVGGHAG